MKSKEIITMQYPYIVNNKLCDGKVHDIRPDVMAKITSSPFDLFVLQYFDLKQQTNALTVLSKNGDTFIKLPLFDYDYLNRLVKTPGMLELVNWKELLNSGSSIELGQFVDLSSLVEIDGEIQNKKIELFNLNDNNNRSPLRLKMYVPYNGLTCSPVSNNRQFRSNGIMLRTSQQYSFSTYYQTNLVTDAVNEMLRVNQDKLYNLESFCEDVEVYIPEGSRSQEILPNEEIVQHYLIPGKHIYTVYSTPCVSREKNRSLDENVTKNVEIFDVPWPDYRDLHDQDIVFRDGFNGTLPISINGTKFEAKNKEQIRGRGRR